MSYEQTNSDGLYIEDSYFDTDGYFVYVAEAAAALSAEASLSASVSVIKSADCAISVVATQTATISHIEGADLFAFTDAALAAEVSRIRDYSISSSSAFSVAIDAVRSVYVAAQADSDSAVSADILRVRSGEAATAAAFSMSTDAEKVIVIAADLVSNFTQTAQADKFTGVISNQTSSASMTVSGGLLQNQQASVSATASLTVTGFITNKRPRQTIAYNSIATTTADKILGTHSLYKDASNKYLEVLASTDFNIGSGVDFAISFYFKPTTGTGKILRAYDPAAARDVWSFTNNGSSVRFSYWTGSTTLNIDLSRTVVGWSFFGVTRSGSNLTFEFENGVGAYSSQTVTLSGAISSGTPVIQIGIPSTSALGYFDEFAMAKGTTTYVPTTGGKLDTTQFLFHFDGNFIDDTSGTAQAQAQLSSAATVSVSAAKVTVASASLSSTATETVTAQATVNFSVLISALAFQTSVVGRLQSDVADLDSAFTLSATVARTKDASANLSADCALTVTIDDLSLFNANLSASASLSAQANTTSSASSAITSTASLTAVPTHVYCQLIYGAGNTSGYITSPGVDIRTLTSTGFTSVQSNFWVRLENSLTAGQKITLYTSGTNHIYLQRGGLLPNGESVNSNDYVLYTQIRITWLQKTAPLTYVRYIDERFYGVNLGSSFDPTAWHNVIIPLTLGASVQDQEGANLSMFYDNVVRIDGVSSGSFNNFDATLSTAQGSQSSYAPPSSLNAAKGGQWGASNNPTTVYLDQIWILNNSGTVPISDFYIDGNEAPISNGLTASGKQAQVWLPFGTLLDRSATAPTWDYTANNRVIPGFVVLGEGSFTADTATTAVGYRLYPLASDMSVVTTLTNTGERIRYGVSSLVSEFTQTTIGQKNAILDSSVASEFTQTTDNSRTRNLDSSLAVASQLTADAVSVLVVDSAFAVTATQTVDANRFRDNDSSQSSEFTQTTLAIKTARAESNFEVIAVKLAIAAKVGQGFIDDLQTTATMTTDARVIAYSTSNLQSTATANFTVTRAAFAESSMASTATVTANVDYLRRNESNQSAEATLTAVGTRVGIGTSALVSSATLTANTDLSRLRTAASNQIVATTVTATGDRYRLGSANLQSSTEQFASVYALVRFEINISALAFEVTAGRVIHLDPLNGLIIEPETRFLVIEQETRELTVAAETRVNKIKGYPTL